jgi:hypothetical protein
MTDGVSRGLKVSPSQTTRNFSSAAGRRLAGIRRQKAGTFSGGEGLSLPRSSVSAEPDGSGLPTLSKRAPSLYGAGVHDLFWSTDAILIHVNVAMWRSAEIAASKGARMVLRRGHQKGSVAECGGNGGMKAADVMVSPVITVGPECSVQTLADILLDNHIKCRARRLKEWRLGRNRQRGRPDTAY